MDIDQKRFEKLEAQAHAQGIALQYLLAAASPSVKEIVGLAAEHVEERLMVMALSDAQLAYIKTLLRGYSR